MTSAAEALTVLFEGPEGRSGQDAARALATDRGLVARTAQGDGWTALCIPENADEHIVGELERMPGAAHVHLTSVPYPLVSIEATGARRAFSIGSGAQSRTWNLGGGSGVVPFVALESEGQPRETRLVRSAGGVVWHAGSYVSGWEGAPLNDATVLRGLNEAVREAGIALSIGVSDRRSLEEARELVDLFQVETQDMHNFDLLRALGEVRVPVVLRRGLGATIEEFLLAAEYLLAGGNGRVALCESAGAAGRSSWGPRFEINAIALLKRLSHLPVVADVGKASNHAEAVTATARAAVAAGADGFMVSVAESSPDTGVPLSVTACRAGFVQVERVAVALGRGMGKPSGDEAEEVPTIPHPPRLRPTPASPGPIRTPVDVLRRVDVTLASVIESVTTVRPRLDVIRQDRIRPPHARWLHWLLQPEGDLLVRWTSYKMGALTLSRNVAYVDFARVDSGILDRLQAQQINLGQLFGSSEIDKFGFAFGTAADAGTIDIALREGHGPRALHPYVWRRYIAATSGRVGFLVVESLPTLTWQHLLAMDVTERAAGGKQ